MVSATPLFSGFKHVACPREVGGGQCTNPGCLFGHRGEQQAALPAPAQTCDGASDDRCLPNVDSERPAKRQRTSTDDALPDPPPREFESQQVTGSGGALDASDKVKASDLYDPLSPPIVVKNRTAIESAKSVTSSSLKHQMPTQPTLACQPMDSTQLKPHASMAFTPTCTSSSQRAEFGPPKTPVSEAARAKPTRTRESLLVKPSAAKSTPSPLEPGSPVVRKAIPTSQTLKVRNPESLNPRLLKSAPATHDIRNKLLQLLHSQFDRLNKEVLKKDTKDAELKKLTLSSQELIWMALDHEQDIAIHKAAIYSNIIKHDVVRYKRMSVDEWIKQRKEQVEKEKRGPEQKPFNGAPVVIKTGLTPEQEVEILQRLVTPIADLQQYGYVPIPPTDEEIAKAKEAVEMSKGWEKCDRCTARFQVFPGRNIETGELASGGKCTHHSGKTYLPDRARGDTSFIPKRYRCCQQDMGETPGCAVGNSHVWKTYDPKRLASLWNYAATPANNDPLVRKATAVCFDCEMGFTVHGLELIRLTATSWPDGAELIDVLVQPYGEILDLNSRYSGVWPEDMARAVSWTKDWKAPLQKPGERKILQKVSSPDVARDLLFSLISPDTILIGHGLENDLNAMRIVHPRLVDTILVYPHRKGLPVRMGLKALMEIHLNQRIQVDTGEGHDSAEDARAAGDLARLKVQKEWSSMQSDGWKLVDGVFKEPGWNLFKVPPMAESSVPKEEPHKEGYCSEDSVDTENRGVSLSEEALDVGS